MLNVIKYSSSVRMYGSIEEFGDIEKFNSLDEIFEKYVDVEYVKEWFGGKDWKNDKDIVLEDVLEEKDGVYVMGEKEVMIDDKNHIYLDDGRESFKGTKGLWSLIMEKKPEMYDSLDCQIINMKS